MRFICFITALIFSAPVFSQTPFAAMTYNIRYDNPGDGADAWPVRRDFLAAQVAFYAPDVFGIQEGLNRQVVYLDSALTDYGYVGVGRDDGAEAGEYSAVFYRTDRFNLIESGTFWLSLTPDTISKGWDAALPRICTWAHLEDKTAGRKIWVYNTHFDHIGKEARQESAQLILQKIAENAIGDDPVILMGDFNLTPDEAPIRSVSEALHDTYTSSEKAPFGPMGTFNGFKFQEPVQRRIDYIFTNDIVQRIQCAILSDSRNCHYPSDHLPVLARMAY